MVWPGVAHMTCIYYIYLRRSTQFSPISDVMGQYTNVYTAQQCAQTVVGTSFALLSFPPNLDAAPEAHLMLLDLDYGGDAASLCFCIAHIAAACLRKGCATACHHRLNFFSCAAGHQRSHEPMDPEQNVQQPPAWQVCKRRSLMLLCGMRCAPIRSRVLTRSHIYVQVAVLFTFHRLC